jgi:hypothetical protein
MFILAELKQQNGELIAVLTLPQKDFKTGSKGFYGTTKAEIEGKRYQVQVQLVEIGSKKQGEGKE